MRITNGLAVQMDSNRISSIETTLMDGELAMSVEIIVRETGTGLEIVSGRRRLEALLALRDEVVVMSPGVGEMVIARLPDGRLQASANPEHVVLFRQPEISGNSRTFA
ncbi:hypothetical protein [Caballeronia sp. INDeC2]|uniref:hypothetical protein n=1 Tax=Caballeronia sp. INDeC2 TaxID=2921747 RepID=UPI002028A91F|nr:hypothetical protein [Caballeronia sp. INDeC2]